ncbi:hypothetical protein HYC85_000739 [Camellia sinensis]|uniref:Chorismate synthase n=1 Tax=Camellia sinensis TaxID=4442 RepID=A0A7J7I3C7_CAMSI|nr:hypothetical protein HYC85_000739 [Camellia sinensis]
MIIFNPNRPTALPPSLHHRHPLPPPPTHPPLWPLQCHRERHPDHPSPRRFVGGHGGVEGGIEAVGGGHRALAGAVEIQAVGNAFGTYFRVTTYGESHGCGVGCVIDGCPPQIPLSEADIQLDLNRRSEQSNYASKRDPMNAKYIPALLKDYSEMSIKYRPSHADATYDFKYGVRSVQGGGRSSARETIGRVAAGAVAKKILKQFSGTEVLAYASQVHDVVLPKDLVDHESLTLDQIESTIVRCPNHEYAEKMIAAIDDVRVRGDSVGGIVTCIVRNVPRGLGSPVFDKLGAELAKAAMSLPASMGFEIGSGFAGTFLTGSEHNDEFFIDEHGRIRTRTNRSGGIQGGISNGELIDMRVAFKPTRTIRRKQHTVTRDKQETELIFRGQQDPCVVPRAVPVVEAMVALVLVDQLMAHYAQCQMFPINPALQEPLEFPRLLEPAATAL